MLYLLAAVFLPLFPFSMGFTYLYTKAPAALRLLLLVLWPAVGLTLLSQVKTALPEGMYYWAVFSALLYVFRSLAVRDFSQWSAYVSVSLLALSWLVMGLSVSWLSVVTLLLPLMLLPVLQDCIVGRFGGAYAGKVNGLMINTPRLAGIMVFTFLALLATPVFPGFFVMLGTALQLSESMILLTVLLMLFWLLLSWSGMRLLQGFLTGEQRECSPPDLKRLSQTALIIMLTLYLLAGLMFSGALI